LNKNEKWIFSIKTYNSYTKSKDTMVKAPQMHSKEFVNTLRHQLDTIEATPRAIDKLAMWRDAMCPLLLDNLEGFVAEESEASIEKKMRLVVVIRDKMYEYLNHPLVQADPVAEDGCKEIERMCNGLLNQQS
jgi:hypothetical protein